MAESINRVSGEVMDIATRSESAIESLTRGEIDIQIKTAKAYPRNIKKCLDEAISMVSINAEVAGDCWYSVPRDGKTISGPSVRLAEIVLASWGNLRASTRLIAEDDRFITAQAAVHDLEKNTALCIETKRRITKRDGSKYSEDGIATTGNAARSIALRDAIFRVIPRTYVEQILAEASRVAAGDVKTLSERRVAMLNHVTKLGIVLPRILAVVGRPSEMEITGEDLATIKGLLNAVKEGTTDIDEAFPEIKKEDTKKQSRADAIADSMAGKINKEDVPPV